MNALTGEDLAFLCQLHTAEIQDTSPLAVMEFWRDKHEKWGVDDDGLDEIAERFGSIHFRTWLTTGCGPLSLAISSFLSGFDVGVIAAKELEMRRVAEGDA